MPRGRPVVALTALGLGLVLVGAGLAPALAAGSADVGAVPATRAATRVPAAAASVPADASASRPAPLPDALRAGRALPDPAAAPARVSVPALGVDAAVVDVRVDADGALGVPDDVTTVGWWTGGSRPGRQGSTVIAGHVDSREQGPGAFFRLRALVAGDTVTVTDRAGRPHAYVVEARRQVAKPELTPDVFDERVAGRLVLITCGGEFDDDLRSYADNVVVYAVPAG